MKFKVGDKVRVVNSHKGGDFENGDIITIECIDFDCYGAISPHTNIMWFLDEKEVQSLTNADKIRSMTNEELADFLGEWASKHLAWMSDSCGEVLFWLQESAKK